MKIDFIIEAEDLKILFALTYYAYPGMDFSQWCEYVKLAYVNYHKRNLSDLERYKEPLTFSKWINGQIIELT